MEQPYTIAIADNPCVTRRDSLKTSGEAVIGFSFVEQTNDDFRLDTLCAMIGSGKITADMIKAMLNTMSNQFSPRALSIVLMQWLQDTRYWHLI